MENFSLEEKSTVERNFVLSVKHLNGIFEARSIAVTVRNIAIYFSSLLARPYLVVWPFKKIRLATCQWFPIFFLRFYFPKRSSSTSSKIPYDAEHTAARYRERSPTFFSFQLLDVGGGIRINSGPAGARPRECSRDPVTLLFNLLRRKGRSLRPSV